MWFILDKNYKRVGILDPNVKDNFLVIGDVHKEDLQYGYATLEFSIPINSKQSKHIKNDNYILYQQENDNRNQLFVIKEVTEEHSSSGSFKKVFCELSVVDELINELVRPISFEEENIVNILRHITQDTDWVLKGEIVDFEAFGYYLTIDFIEYPTVLDALYQVLDSFLVEVTFNVEFDNNQIVEKQIILEQRRGSRTNYILTYGKEIDKIERIESTKNNLTSMIGVGKGNEEGQALDLRGLVSSVPGYVVENDYIYSVEALARNNGKHKFGVYKDTDSITKEELERKTIMHLQQFENPLIQYKVDVLTLEQLTGYKHKKLRIGDFIVVHDDTFVPALVLQARVLSKETRRDGIDVVTLGEFVNRTVRETRALEKVKAIIRVNEEKWNTTESRVIAETGREIDEKVNEVVGTIVPGMIQDGKNKIYYSRTAPVNPQIDDTWFEMDSKNVIIAMKVWKGSSWFLSVNNDWINQAFFDSQANKSEVINLSTGKVSINEVIEKINATPENIRIYAKRLHISGETLIDNATIKNAMIDSVAANKIAATSLSAISANLGTVNAGVVNGITMNSSIINSGTIIGANIKTTSEINKGIIMNSNGLMGYDQNGNQVFSLNAQTGLMYAQNGYFVGTVTSSAISGSTITGGTINGTYINGSVMTGNTIRTSETSNRGIILNTNGLLGYDQNGNQVFSLNAQTGLMYAQNGYFVGTINGSTITGSTINGATINGGRINVDTSIYVGDNIFMGGNSSSIKRIQFGSSSSYWKNHYIEASSDLLAIKSSGFVSLYGNMGLTLSAFYSIDINAQSVKIDSSDAIVLSSYNTTVQCTGGYGTPSVFVFSTGDGGSNGSQLRLGSSSVSLRNGDNSAYRNLYAGTVYSNNTTLTSKREFKKNIEEKKESMIGKSVLEEIINTKVYEYHLNQELDSELKHTGLILDESPVDIIDPSGHGIDLYSMISFMWKGIQEQQEIINSLKKEIKDLKNNY